MTDVSRYTVGWICAIDTEYTAARAFLDETHEPPEAIPVHDHNAYTLGRVGKHNVVIAVLPDGEYGLSTAGVVAQRMLGSFPNVRVGLMVGIGGGAPCQRLGHDIRLGDIVVSSPRDGHTGVLQYDFGKTIQDQEFKVTRSLNLPPDVLRAAVTKLRVTFEEEGNNFPEAIDAALAKRPRLRRKYGRPPSETDRLFLSHVVHDPDDPIETPAPDLLVSRPERGEDDDNLAVFYGLIASANQLMKDAKVRDKYATEKNVLCFEMEAAGLMNHFPCLVIRGICDYSDSHKNKQWQGYAAMAAAAYAKALLSIVLPTKIENEKRLAEIVESGLQDVVDAMAGMSRRVDDEVLKHLPVAKGAAYNSKDDQREDTCLAGTRVDLLKKITQWAQDPKDQRIYWLKGMAGTGKSTISRTFATTCAERNILGASFFFKRGESDRSDAGLFFTTIARQLVDRRQDLRQPMVDAIKDDPDVSSKRMSEQCRKLLEEPLKQAQLQSHEPSQVLIIDALDECTDDRDVKDLVVLLSKLSERRSFGLKTFITSRPDIAAEFAFGSIDGFYQEVILQEVQKDVIDHDISTYMDTTLSTIRDQWNCSMRGKSSSIAADWPGRESLGVLVEHAKPLFISAATVCRFVQDYRRGNPQEQLEFLLQAIQNQEVGGAMYATYFPILQNFMKGGGGFKRQDSHHLQSFRRIIGTVILLEEPMCAESLSQLIKVKTAEVTRITDLLRSVLDISSAHNSPIRLFHLSFRDFLVSPESGKFSIDSREAHAKIGRDCIDLLCSGRSLHYNVGALQPGDHISKLDNQALQQKFPPHMRYACIHLIHHLKESHVLLRDGDNVHRFLRIYLVFWTEALVVLGKSSMVVSIIDKLISLVEISVGRELAQLLKDYKVFVLSYIATFAKFPLQLYWSALLFSPGESLTRKTFANCLPPAVTLISGGASRWPQLRIISGFESLMIFVGSMAVSPDSKLLACGALDGRLSIWLLPTGENIHQLSTLELHKQKMSCIEDPDLQSEPRIVSLVFSANSEQLVVASSRYFYVYNTGTGVLVRTFGSEGMRTTHIDAPHDSTPLVDFASAHPEGALGMWSISMDRPTRWLEIPGLKRVCSSPEGEFGDIRDRRRGKSWVPQLLAAVGFLKDRKLVAGYFQTVNTTHVWSVAQGHHLYRVESTPTDYFEKVFSSSSMIPAIVRKKNKIDVFDITLDGDETSHLMIRMVKYVVPSIKRRRRGKGQIAVSPDNRFAAFRALGGYVMVWSLPDAKMMKRIEISMMRRETINGEHPERPQPDLRFSGDGRYLILAGLYHIAIWSTTTLTDFEDTRQVLQADLQPVETMVIEILASSDDLVVTKGRIWSTTSGRVIGDLDELTTDVDSCNSSSTSTSDCPDVRSCTKAYFSPNGQYLVLDYEDGLHYVHNTHSGYGFTINTYLKDSETPPRPKDLNGPPGTHFFSSDSKSIGVCGPQGVVIYELSTGKCLWRYPTGEPPIALSQDGGALICCAASPENHMETSIIRCSITENKRSEVQRFVNRDSVLKFSPDLSWTLFKRVYDDSVHEGSTHENSYEIRNEGDSSPSGEELQRIRRDQGYEVSSGDGPNRKDASDPLSMANGLASSRCSSRSEEGRADFQLILVNNDDKSRFRQFRYKQLEHLADPAFSEDSAKFAEGTGSGICNPHHRVSIWFLTTSPIALYATFEPKRSFLSIDLHGSSLFLDMSERRARIDYAEEIGSEKDLTQPKTLVPKCYGLCFDDSRQWIVHNGHKLIWIPKDLRVRGWGEFVGDRYSRTGEGYMAWITDTLTLLMIRFSEGLIDRNF